MVDSELEDDIARWHHEQISDGATAPDFWDECDTSDGAGLVISGAFLE